MGAENVRWNFLSLILPPPAQRSDFMTAWLALIVGILIWTGVMWDGFATIVLPRTVAPMKRLSGRFYNWSWHFWSWIGSKIRTEERRLSFLAVYGPLSVVLLLVLWASLAVFAFALAYRGSGSRFQEDGVPVSFGTLLYMSGSTFLTLGLGDVTSPDSLGRAIMVLEAATGFVFLGLIITYMPLLDQAYAGREVGALLLQSRAGKPASAVRLLRRCAAGPDRAEILRANLREGEHWLAEVMQSHLSHPVLCFYRASITGNRGSSRSQRSWTHVRSWLLEARDWCGSRRGSRIGWDCSCWGT